MFLSQKADLDAFRSVYLETLGMITKEHGLIETISVSPAAPPPIAIMCGIVPRYLSRVYRHPKIASPKGLRPSGLHTREQAPWTPIT